MCREMQKVENGCMTPLSAFAALHTQKKSIYSCVGSIDHSFLKNPHWGADPLPPQPRDLTPRPLPRVMKCLPMRMAAEFLAPVSWFRFDLLATCDPGLSRSLHPNPCFLLLAGPSRSKTQCLLGVTVLHCEKHRPPLAGRSL